MKNPIFICGHRKSGTTMFHNLFDGHNQLMVYPSDLNLLYAYFPIYMSDKYSNKQRRERLDTIIFKDLQYQLKGQGFVNYIDIKSFRNSFFNSIVDSDLINMQVIISKLMDSYAFITDQINKTPIIKETSIEIYAKEIKEWFPNAKFLHLIRDPRDNYAALKSGVLTYYKKMGEDEKETLASLIHRISIGFDMGLLNTKVFNPNEDYFIIKFEDLIKNTKGIMQFLSDKLGINYQEVLLTPTRFNMAVSGNNFDGKKLTKVSNTNVNKWLERISEEEAKIIEFHLASLMEKYNYELYFQKDECVSAVADFYKWQNYRYFFSDRFKSLEE